ncbi:MAG: SDR family oxidoreductase [Lachnospiraceae bacterium]|nr:SDR family oxidoreductase [Lachnospiraceae bacterium]
MQNYENKIAVITGGTSGLGYAFADLLGQAGAKVVITGRRMENGEKAEAELKDKGIEALYVQQDVTEEESWDKLLKIVLGTYGRIDYGFINAGVMARPKPSMQLTMNDWNWVLDTNIRGTLLGLRKFTGAMMMQESGGTIVTTASTASIAPFSMWGPYSVSKAAVLRLVESFKGEMTLGKITKIQYCVSLPGVFESDVINGTCYRSEKYKNPGEADMPVAPSKAHTPDGDKLGYITAAEAAQSIIDQMEAGKFYIYTHEDLSLSLLPEQFKSLRNEQGLTDQAVFDFAFYAKKLAAQGVDVKASNLQNMTQNN